MKGKPSEGVTEAMRGRTHPQFDGPIGNPKAGKRARFSYRGGWHTPEIASVTGGDSQSHAVKSLTGNKHK